MVCYQPTMVHFRLVPQIAPPHEQTNRASEQHSCGAHCEKVCRVVLYLPHSQYAGCLCVYPYRLPEIQEELYRVLQQTERELEELPPPPPSNPLGEILRVLDEFKRDLSQRVEGTPDADGILQNIRPHTTKFRRRIRATAPEFVPWESGSHRASQSIVMPAATFLSNEEESETDALRDGPVIEHAGSEIYVDKVMDRAQTSVCTCFH